MWRKLSENEKERTTVPRVGTEGMVEIKERDSGLRRILDWPILRFIRLVVWCGHPWMVILSMNSAGKACRDSMMDGERTLMVVSCVYEKIHWRHVTR